MYLTFTTQSSCSLRLILGSFKKRTKHTSIQVSKLPSFFLLCCYNTKNGEIIFFLSFCDCIHHHVNLRISGHEVLQNYLTDLYPTYKAWYQGALLTFVSLFLFCMFGSIKNYKYLHSQYQILQAVSSALPFLCNFAFQLIPIKIGILL